MTLKMAHIKKINKKHPQDLWTESFQRPGAYNTAHSLFTAMGQQGEHWKTVSCGPGAPAESTLEND